jgi:hypothetical protein
MFIVGHVAEVKVSNWFNGQLGLNVLHYRCSAITGAGVTEAEAAPVFDIAFSPVYAALMTNAALYLGVSVRDITNVPHTASAIANANQANGTAGTHPLPTQTCGLFKLATGLAGRSGRGRVYVPFPDQADNTAGDQPAGGYIVRLGNLATVIFTSYNVVGAGGTSTFKLVVRKAKSLSVTDVSQVIARLNWATQRRRGAFGAKNPQDIAQ